MMEMNKLEIEDDFFFSDDLAQKIVLTRELVKDQINFDDGKYEDVYAYGYNFFSSGQYDKAKDIFKVLLFADHANPKGYIALGGCLQKLEEYEKAIQVYLSAYVVAPTNATILLNLGLCYMSLNDYKSAEAGFLHAHLLGLQDKEDKKKDIANMAERLWKMTRNKQNKEKISIKQSLIQVDE